MKECGRVLGIRYHTDKLLYVLEASSGLYQVNLTTNHKKQLLKRQDKQVVIYNDLVFDPDRPDLVYITVSSNKWFLEQIAYSILEHENSGYILAYNIRTGQSVQLLSGLSLVNGIDITRDGKYLLFSETNNFNIKKVSLTSVRKAVDANGAVQVDQVTVFGDLLPGEPDNIRVDPITGDVLVGMFTSRPEGKVVRDYINNWPFVRKAVARTAYTLHIALKYVQVHVFTNPTIDQLSFDLYSGHFVYKALPNHGGSVLKLDGTTGKLKQVLGSNEFNSVSEALTDSEGNLYYGSFRNTFLGVLPKGSH